MTGDLFADLEDGVVCEPLAPGALVLRRFALQEAEVFLALLAEITTQAPLRHPVTPGGRKMSVAMSNCGSLGWVSDHNGYRYVTHDPVSGLPWPLMPDVLQCFAHRAAAEAGFADFDADACLINRYAPGARMSLHQDRDESDFTQPIVSLSLGLPAVFLFGGLRRTDPVRRVLLMHGDVVVWGGAARLCYHAVLPLKGGQHPDVGSYRFNLTFRKAAQVP